MHDLIAERRLSEHHDLLVHHKLLGVEVMPAGVVKFRRVPVAEAAVFLILSMKTNDLVFHCRTSFELRMI